MEPDEIIEPDEAPAAGFDRKTALMALGLLGALALTLALIRTARPTRPDSVGTIVDGNWQASLEHLAHNVDLRLALIDDRLDEIAADKVAKVAAGAAVSVPAEPLAPGDDHLSDRPVVAVGAEEPAPPGPAAVSLPGA